MRGRTDIALATELAKVFRDQARAHMLLGNAGFPLERAPTSCVPLVFWSQVLEEANNGVFHGGIFAITEQAANLYPANPVFIKIKKNSNP